MWKRCNGLILQKGTCLHREQKGRRKNACLIYGYIFSVTYNVWVVPKYLLDKGMNECRSISTTDSISGNLNSAEYLYVNAKVTDL